MWKNIVERGKPQMTIRRIRIACRITKATNTHEGCVIVIAFLLQQWLHERTSMLHCKYIACLFVFIFNSKETWPCHGSGSYALASHRRWPDLIPGLSTCDSLQTTWPWDGVVTEYMSCPVSIIPPTFVTQAFLHPLCYVILAINSFVTVILKNKKENLL
jgi:hypothetical protein